MVNQNNSQPEQPVRQLIRFSNYSLCITIPKEYTDTLGWKQGDRLLFELNGDGVVLTKQDSIPKLTKNPIPSAPLNQPTIPPQTQKPATPDMDNNSLEPTDDDLQPIPPI